MRLWGNDNIIEEQWENWENVEQLVIEQRKIIDPVFEPKKRIRRKTVNPDTNFKE